MVLSTTPEDTSRIINLPGSPTVSEGRLPCSALHDAQASLSQIHLPGRSFPVSSWVRMRQTSLAFPLLQKCVPLSTHTSFVAGEVRPHALKRLPALRCTCQSGLSALGLVAWRRQALFPPFAGKPRIKMTRISSTEPSLGALE